MSKSIYDEAEEAGREAGKSARRRAPTLVDHNWEGSFICWYSSKHPGFEAAYRRFAVGFDPKNKRWAEGNDD